MDKDDGRRGTRGVVASLVHCDGGRVRLVFDDVERAERGNAMDWQPIRLFTSSEFDAATIADSAVPRQQLAEIGFNLLTRLAALSGMVK